MKKLDELKARVDIEAEDMKNGLPMMPPSLIDKIYDLIDIWVEEQYDRLDAQEEER